jgi:hypothetical protein
MINYDLLGLELFTGLITLPFGIIPMFIIDYIFYAEELHKKNNFIIRLMTALREKLKLFAYRKFRILFFVAGLLFFAIALNKYIELIKYGNGGWGLLSGFYLGLFISFAIPARLAFRSDEYVQGYLGKDSYCDRFGPFATNATNRQLECFSRHKKNL